VSSYKSGSYRFGTVYDRLGFRCVNGVRVDRGGRWGLGPDYVRCSYRDRSGQGGNGSSVVGFRSEW